MLDPLVPASTRGLQLPAAPVAPTPASSSTKTARPWSTRCSPLAAGAVRRRGRGARLPGPARRLDVEQRRVLGAARRASGSRPSTAARRRARTSTSPSIPTCCASSYPDAADEIDDEFRTRPVSHVINAAVQLTPAAVAVPMTGQQAENLVVVVPAPASSSPARCARSASPRSPTRVIPAAWADALDQLIELAPIVVPGHGRSAARRRCGTCSSTCGLRRRRR